MHIIRSETVERRLASVKSLAMSHAKSLTESLGKTLGETFRVRQASPQSLVTDYMHGSPQDSLRDSLFYAGTYVGNDFFGFGPGTVYRRNSSFS